MKFKAGNLKRKALNSYYVMWNDSIPVGRRVFGQYIGRCQPSIVRNL